MRTKAQVEVVSMIFWFIVIFVLLFLFGFFFIQTQDFTESKAQVEDKEIDWEAGYLALSLSQMPIEYDDTLYTIGEFVTLVPEHNWDTRVDDAIASFVSNTTIPDGEVFAYLYSGDLGVCMNPSDSSRFRTFGETNENCRILNQQLGISDAASLIENIRTTRGADAGYVVFPTSPAYVLVVIIE